VTEIGSWTTAEGTVPATLDFESQDVDAQELPAWVKSAGLGALTGALTGSAAGPYGALAGAVAGGALGAAGSLTKPAPVPPSKPASTSTAAPPATPTPQPTASAASPQDTTAAPATAAAPTADATSTALGPALQQLATILPLLMQAAAASGGSAKGAGESFEMAAEIGVDLEALEPSEWEFASLEGGWTIS
jgi:hypothetical protein